MIRFSELERKPIQFNIFEKMRVSYKKLNDTLYRTGDFCD